MNPLLAEILRSGTVTGASGREVKLHSQLPLREGMLLQYWLRQYRPQRLLEIGLAYGISTLFICDAMAGLDIEYYDVIDAFQHSEWQGIGLSNLAAAGFRQRVELHEELSELCLPRLLEQGKRYDFAFVDGWHTFDHVLVEFFYINRMLEVGGIVLFDDVHLPALQKVLAYIDGYEGYERLALPADVGNSVPMKVRRMMGLPPVRVAGFVKTAEDERDWDWYREF